MSLYRRKDSPHWWINLAIGGRRVQESTGTTDRKKAREYHDRAAGELWKQSKLGTKPRYTWNEAVVRYVAEIAHKAAIAAQRIHLRWVDPFLSGLALVDIDRAKIDAIRRKRLECEVSNATVNRMLEAIRAVLNRAYGWEWIDRVPRVDMLPERERRIRWLTREEAQGLLAELPQHLRVMAAFSLETGLRRANVTGIEWSQVDVVRRVAWIHPDQAKARKAIAVPLSQRAVEIVSGELGKHLTHVFTFRGKPVRQTNTKAWRKALLRAGIQDFRWHDLRHTWASWHIQAGTPAAVLQELGGWASHEMVRRYAHLSAEHLHPWVDRLGRYDFATLEEQRVGLTDPKCL